MSLPGRVDCRRAYYCGRCGKGVVPWDERAGLTARSFTPAAERLAGLAGAVCSSFDEAATRVLPEMAGLKSAETTVQRAGEGVGACIGALRRAGRTLGFARRWGWRRPRPDVRLRQPGPDRRPSDAMGQAAASRR